MSEPGFTPGPWRLNCLGVFAGDGSLENDRVVVALGARASAEEVANARLIAAAPALYEALEPFAKAAEIKLCGEWADDKHFGQTDVGFYLTFGDLRKALAALSLALGEKP